MKRLLSRASLAEGGGASRYVAWVWAQVEQEEGEEGGGRYNELQSWGEGRLGLQPCPCPHSMVRPAKSVSEPRRGGGVKGRDWGGVGDR